MLPHKSLQREIIKIKKRLHALNSQWNEFFLKPPPSAYTSIFIGFLGILIMVYCDENCGHFFPPTLFISLCLHRNQQVGRVKVCHKPSVKYAKATRRWYFQKPVKTSWVVFEWLGNLVKPWQGGVVAAVSPCAFFTQLFSLFQFGIYVGFAKKFNGNSLKIIVTTIHY